MPSQGFGELFKGDFAETRGENLNWCRWGEKLLREECMRCPCVLQAECLPSFSFTYFFLPERGCPISGSANFTKFNFFKEKCVGRVKFDLISFQGNKF